MILMYIFVNTKHIARWLLSFSPTLTLASAFTEKQAKPVSFMKELLYLTIYHLVRSNYILMDDSSETRSCLIRDQNA